MIEEASKADKIVIVGDFNFKQINWKDQIVNGSIYSQPAKFYSCIEDSFLKQHVMDYTRKRGKSKESLLDLAITDLNQTQVTESIKISDAIAKSDHYTIQFSYLTKITETEEDTTGDCNLLKKKLDYNKGKYDELNQKLAEIDWKDLLKTTINGNIDEVVENFYNKIEELERQFVPEYLCNRKDTDKPPWITKALRKKTKNKYFCWLRYQETKSYKRYLEYVKVRNKVSKDIRKQKK